jgi:hypothetical protein
MKTSFFFALTLLSTLAQANGETIIFKGHLTANVQFVDGSKVVGSQPVTCEMSITIKNEAPGKIIGENLTEETAVCDLVTAVRFAAIGRTVYPLKDDGTADETKKIGEVDLQGNVKVTLSDNQSVAVYSFYPKGSHLGFEIHAEPKRSKDENGSPLMGFKIDGIADLIPH